MYFCEFAIGLFGSVPTWPMPRLTLCRTVRNVVVELIRTKMPMTIFALAGPGARWYGGSGLVTIRSAIVAVKMCACCALATTAGVSPYQVLSSAMARSTLNSAKKTGSWITRGRHPASGFAPFAW